MTAGWDCRPSLPTKPSLEVARVELEDVDDGEREEPGCGELRERPASPRKEGGIK